MLVEWLSAAAGVEAFCLERRSLASATLPGGSRKRELTLGSPGPAAFLDPALLLFGSVRTLLRAIPNDRVFGFVVDDATLLRADRLRLFRMCNYPVRGLPPSFGSARSVALPAP